MFVISFFKKLRPLHMYDLSCVLRVSSFTQKKDKHQYDTTHNQEPIRLYTIVVYMCSIHPKKQKKPHQHCFEQNNQQKTHKHINSWFFLAKRFFLLALIILKTANSWDHHHILSQKVLSIIQKTQLIYMCGFS